MAEHGRQVAERKAVKLHGRKRVAVEGAANVTPTLFPCFSMVANCIRSHHHHQFLQVSIALQVA
jgi:hypothetical protein